MSYQIMVVDNSPSIRKILAFILKNAGHKVIEAEDGLDALKKMESSLPDIVFADLNMPNMDGFEFIRSLQVNARYRSVPVIVVTAENDPLKKKKAKNIGAAAWITKPIKAEQINKAVSKILG